MAQSILEKKVHNHAALFSIFVALALFLGTMSAALQGQETAASITRRADAAERAMTPQARFEVVKYRQTTEKRIYPRRFWGGTPSR